ncbi:hypothetical protein DY218_15515 [Streptomyces triticagri]|uniref:LPXTG cell wall anchor domain-containing protein n=1 Tax=Streptomyces triticagri TaxID=2293568 RepID=A0A372M4D9_9ACTN|nr:hypothetical protein [Streptomyces triticagri]RFU85808.1 hypothetical protein DY218_15515 [Streptomyces triticagri]
MRIARALATTALASAALLATAPAALADTAEVTPGTVPPGGTVTISVSCDAPTSPAPDTITADSQAFELGSVQLTRVPGANSGVAGPAYRGTAKIAAADKFTGSGPNAVGPRSTWSVDGNCPGGGQWNARFTVAGGGATGTASPTATQPAVRGGVGGSFTDSGTTVIIGGALVACAIGATCVVLRRRRGGARH